MRIDLGQMLAARDRRADIQREMLGQGGGSCLACLTLNIAGDVKRTPMSRRLFERGVSEFESLGLKVLDYRETDGATGSEAFWLLDEDAEKVKALLEGIEDDETIAASRLFDFDVLARTARSRSADGEGPDGVNGESSDEGCGSIIKLSRGAGRQCLLCDRPAAECARSRRHGLDAVRAVTESLLREFCADTLAAAGRDALISELETTPKPGLVDLNNNGAHRDMNPELFRKSADALMPYYKDAALLGMDRCSMKELRPRGIEAEREMFEATGGVNTHKGLIYSMGLLMAGMGRALAEAEAKAWNDEDEKNAQSVDAYLESLCIGAVKYAADLASEDAEEELRKAKDAPATNGGAVYKNTGAKGATGEAASGFPGALYCADRFKYYLQFFSEEQDKARKDMNCSETGEAAVGANYCETGEAAVGENYCETGEAAVFALIDSMARLDDTNLIHRGGIEGLDYVKAKAKEIAELPLCERIAAAEKLDKDMIEKNLSPGGSADMLALAFLLVRWEELSLRGVLK